MYNHHQNKRRRKKMILQQQFQQQQAMMDHHEVARIRKRFGDEQSTLLDQFERLSFETHFNKAMLQRSLSEPGLPRSVSQPRHVSAVAATTTPATVPLLNHGKKKRRCRGAGLNKALKKLLRPIFGRKSGGGGERKHAMDPRNPLSWPNFSRSMRF